jgi:hypothetical protein
LQSAHGKSRLQSMTMHDIASDLGSASAGLFGARQPSWTLSAVVEARDHLLATLHGSLDLIDTTNQLARLLGSTLTQP